MKQLEALEALLKITYSREIELEKHIENVPYSGNLWFFEQTKNLNIALQISCLEEIEKIKRREKYNYSGLH